MSDPKTYTDDFAKFADRINRIEASIRNLRVPRTDNSPKP